MRFDLFHELAMPPALARSEADMFAQTLAEIAAADALGFDCAWLVEHHFMPGYSHSSKPELVLAACAARTERLRLGLAIIPLPYHHPVHVAERIATLDILSGGRLEVGIGRGFSPPEYAAFGVRMEDSRQLVAESLEVLRASFRGAPVTAAGPRFPLDGVRIVPHQIQQPHPPLWTAAVSPDTFDWAAREALGVLVGPFKPWFMAEADIRRYRDAWIGPEAPRVGVTVGMLCLPDGRRARALAAPALSWFYGELLRVTAPVLEQLYPSYEHFRAMGKFRRLAKLGARPRFLAAAGMTIVGDPAECIARIRRLEAAGVTHLLCAVGAGALPTEVVRESLECFAREVMPAFRRDDDAQR
ncbi:MAG: LLM class flavin-dependent oxidoreductase [Burkholderiales bacterium]|nr:LLM class flavin-dependent oxidoreductase [Burkholderiales bacterium]